jgi:hypothetical protein
MASPLSGGEQGLPPPDTSVPVHASAADAGMYLWGRSDRGQVCVSQSFAVGSSFYFIIFNGQAPFSNVLLDLNVGSTPVPLDFFSLFSFVADNEHPAQLNNCLVVLNY